MEQQQKDVNITIEQPAAVPVDNGMTTGQIVGGAGVIVIGGLVLEILRRKFWPKKKAD